MRRRAMSISAVVIAFLLCFLVDSPIRCWADSATESSTASMRIEEDQQTGGWKVFHGDSLVAGYVPNSGTKPIVYPVLGPSGQRMTRDFPMMAARPDERSDHNHHRSLWLTHGDVNGIDFWMENKDKGCGEIVQRSIDAEVDESTGDAVIVTENDWKGPDGKRVLSDIRRLTFGTRGGRRIIDCDALLKATDGDVNFGDTKEGSFGMRVAGTMKVDAKQGGVITNADGQTDKEAWGQKSPWVDYSGPIDGDLAGVTIHNHPSSFGFPCRWHVRTYGLFAANPFGVHHFTGGEKTSGVLLRSGDQMRLSYRIMLHDGALDADQTAKDAAQYADQPRPGLEVAGSR